MIRAELRLILLALAFGLAMLGCSACRKEEVKEQHRQTLPLVGNPTSPLPTPNIGTSPVKP